MINHKNIITLLITLFTVFTLTSSMAQTRVAIGAKMGPSFSSLKGDDVGETNRRTGFTGGIYFNIIPLEFLSIQPEILYNQKGAENINEYFNTRQTIKLDYIDFPVLVKLRIPINNTVYPHIYAGPIFSKTINSKYEIEQLDSNVEVGSDFDARGFDFGGVFGFGLDIEVDKLFLTADLRYGISAIDFDDGDESFDLKNTEIMLLIGAGILLGK